MPYAPAQDPNAAGQPVDPNAAVVQPQQQLPVGTYAPGELDGYHGGRSNYGVLTNQDWLTFQQPNPAYVPTPVMGAAYDRTAYPVAVAEPQVQAIIQGALSKGNPTIKIGGGFFDVALLQKFYSLRGYQPAFVTSTGLRPQAAIVRDLLKNKSALKGLDPADYWNDEMELRYNAAATETIGKRAGLDVMMAQSYIRLAADLENGRTDGKLIDSYWMLKKRPFNDFQALNNTVRDGVDLVKAFESFEPQHADYQRLEQALPNLFAIKAKGGWPKISGVKILKVGVSSPDVPLVRARLMELNIIPFSPTVDQSPIYTQADAAAVKEFQADNKIKPDGIIGKQGFAVLNATIDYRIMEVRATLEKWRWMPRNLGNRYIVVNIARQEMRLTENGQTVMEMRTINGQVIRPTNILFDSIVAVDMNPYWNPPPDLIHLDIIPGQLADPNHIQANHVRVFGGGGQEINPSTVNWAQYKNTNPPYVFREDPGTDNSLGVVKFQTTNPSAIYLHDTNTRNFFEQFDERYISSGCIRLQHPLDLMQYLLRNKPEWTPAAIDQVLAAPTQYPHHVVQLGKDALPFYVFYGTASFDDKGNLRFARDGYHLDERLVRAMTPQSDNL